LLIVVAIIAILAAIAVPNFLEAQIRSKVSRAKSDQRVLAVGIEAYAVDWNRPPLAVNELETNRCASWTTGPPWTEIIAQSKMTTPVAYVSSLPINPFSVNTFSTNQKTGVVNREMNRPMTYRAVLCPYLSAAEKNVRAAGYTWLLLCHGPSRNGAGQYTNILLGGTFTAGQTGGAYDPSNGAASYGWIMRTNKGVFTVPLS